MELSFTDIQKFVCEHTTVEHWNLTKGHYYCIQVSSQLELLSEELQHMEMVTDGSKAEQLLQIHNESVMHVQNCTYEVIQRGQELAQVRLVRHIFIYIEKNNIDHITELLSGVRNTLMSSTLYIVLDLIKYGYKVFRNIQTVTMKIL